MGWNACNFPEKNWQKACRGGFDPVSGHLEGIENTKQYFFLAIIFLNFVIFFTVALFSAMSIYEIHILIISKLMYWQK